MFKKAGIVLTVSAAGLLAVTPLAFAGGNDEDYHHHHHGHDVRDFDNNIERNDVHLQNGLVNLQDIGVQVPVQACNNSVVEGALGILALGQSNSDRHNGTCVQGNSSR